MEKCIVTQSRLLIVRIHWEFTINTFHEKLFWFHTRVLYSAPRKPIILLVNYDSCWQHQMSVRSLRHDRPNGRFSKSRGLSASVSFLSSPPLPALLLAPFFARSLTLVPRSLFLHRTETLATQATSSQVLLQIRIEHKEYICHRCIADWAKTLLSL